MPLNTPSYSEIVDRINADIAVALPDVDPTIFGSFVRAFAISTAGRHFDNVLSIEQLSNVLFPQTSSGEFLERWAQYEGISRLPAAVSSGNITVTGVATTLVPALTEFRDAENVLVLSLSDETLAVQSFSITSLTRSGSTVTGTTATNHTLATGITATIAGAVETDYSGAFVLTVLSETTFSYEITGTPTTPATGTITVAYTGASLSVEAITPGTSGNLSAGAQLQLTSPIAGVDTNAFVQTLGLSGGSDTETDESLLNRTIQSRSNPVANFNVSAIEKEVFAVAGVTRVFVKRITPYVGGVTVAFLRDDDASGAIPDAGEVADVRAVLVEILPAQSDTADLFVLAPVAVPVDFTFTNITPDTSTMRTAITANLGAFFRDEVDYEADVDEDKYRAAIINTIDTETGSSLESFVLSAPSGDIAISTNEIGTLGSVIYP